MFFDRNEIHIQAFAEIPPGNESQEIPRIRLFMIFKNSPFLIIENPGIQNFKIQKVDS